MITTPASTTTTAPRAPVAVLSGEVREERLALDGCPRQRTFAVGEVFHFAPSHIHRVRHAGADPAVTLHVYSPPLERMGAYVVDDDGILVRHPMPPLMSFARSSAQTSTEISTLSLLASEASRTGMFSFPNPVNEVSARLVAGGVVLMSAVTIAVDQPWLTAVIAYGFIARVMTGPTLSPLGQFVTRVVTPRLHVAERPVAGPPKRFAQGIGAAFSITAAVLALGFGLHTAAYAVLCALMFAATLESVFGLCLGCSAFALLMRAGVIPEEVCERCANVRSA